MKRLDLEPRHEQLFDLLRKGKTLSEARSILQYSKSTFESTLSQLMRQVQDAVGISWQHCVIREYIRLASPNPNPELPDFPTSTILPNPDTQYLLEGELHQLAFTQFLASKDSELQELELLYSNLKTRVPKASAASPNS